MANKMVEMTFAIGAVLSGGFSGAFGKAGQALGELQKRSSELQQVSGQVGNFQKMQEAITKNHAAMVDAQNQAKALETQIVASSQKTAMLKSQYGEAQAEVERLNAVLVRNKDAHKAAQLNAQSLERQIRSSKTPTSELQKQYEAAQEQVRKLGEAVKKSGAEFQQAQAKTKHLKSEMQASAAQTKSLKSEADNLKSTAEKLQTGIDRDREAITKLRTELTGAGIDTNRLSAEQARLTQQSQRLADAQTRIQKSRAALQETRQKLSWGNVKGDLIKAAGIGVSLGAPVMEAAEFEHAAARLNAVAFSGGGRDAKKDAESFKELQKQARQLGRDTQFTAVQAAQSQENLARAGFNANEIISAMPGLLDMAAAEGMDLATAADIMASSLRGFGLEAKDASRVSNILAQTSAASNSSITGLGDSLKYVAPVASGLGISIEETNAMLGVMANAGIKGSQGGTALRAAFLRLSKEPKAVAKALGELGIKARDANGKMRDMPELMQALSKCMKDMGSADKMKYLSNIFGSEAASGMLAVMDAAVDGTLQDLTRLNRESSGQLQALSKSIGLSVDDLRAGMQDADKYARALGISFGDLSVYTAMLAQNDIKGAQANKMLTQAFSRITDKPKEVQKALKSYGIALKDDKGRMRDFNAILIDLNNNMKDMKPPDQLKELTKIFGKEGALAIQELMKGMGKGGLYDQYSEIVNSATGVSREMAEKVLATFWGQKQLFQSAISDIMISAGEVLLPATKEILESFKKFAEGLGKWMKENPEWTKWIIGTVAGLSALSVGITALKYAWLGIKLPFQTAKVAFDLLSVKLLTNADTLAEGAKSAGLFSKIGGKLSAAAKGIGKAFSAIGSGISKALSGIMNMGRSLISGLFSPMGIKILLIAGLIAGLAAAAYLIYKNWDKIKEWWNSWVIPNVWEPIKGYASAACNYVKNLWNDFWTWWDSWTLSDVFEAVKGYASQAWSYVSQKWQEFGTWWNSWSLKDIFQSFSVSWDSILLGWEDAKSIIASGWENVRSIFTLENLDNVWEYLTNGFGTAKDLLLSGWNNLAGMLTIDFSGFWDTLASGFATVCDTIKGAWNGVTGFIKDTWNTASDYVSGAWKWTKGLFGYDTDAEDLQTQIQDITALNKMSEGFSQRVAEMTAAWQPFKTSLGEGFEQIYSVMQGIADRIRGITIPAVNELASALSKIATEVSSIVQAGGLEVEVKTPNTPTATNYSRTVGGMNRGGYRPHALGGIFSQPHLGLVAEAGREAVIPLEDKVRGIPLWKAAGEEMGLLFGNTTTNNDNRNSSMIFNPTYNITVNGGEPGIEQRFRQIVEETVADMMNQAERIAFQ